MSNYETAEQRQIRQLRQTIQAMERSAKDNKRKEDKIRRRLEEERRSVEEANRRLTRDLSSQQEQNRRQQSAIDRHGEQLDALDRQIQEKERLSRQRIQEMGRQYEAAMRRTQEEFRAQNETLQNVIAATRTEMRESLEAARKETDQKLRDQEARLHREMQQTEQEINEKIRQADEKIESVIQDLRAKQESEETLAQYWLEQANRILEEMENDYRPQLFEETAYGKLRQDIGLARSDSDSGRFTSAADGARAAFYDAMDMKERLIQAEMEWNLWYNEIKEREQRLLEQLERADNRIYQGQLEDGSEITDDSGIDYWTRGQLSVVRERIDQMTERLGIPDKKAEGNLEEAGIEALYGKLGNRDTDYLRDQVNELIGLEQELLQVENASHTNFTMAVNRYQTAGRIEEILGNSYLMTESDGNYFREEPREAYHAVYQNPKTGDQAAVVITPLYGEDGVVTNHIELIVGNADNNPKTREAITSSVAGTLNEAGVMEGGFPCAQAYGEQTSEEIARVGNIDDVAAGRECVHSTVGQRAAAAWSAAEGHAAAAGVTAAGQRTAATGRAGAN